MSKLIIKIASDQLMGYKKAVISYISRVIFEQGFMCAKKSYSTTAFGMFAVVFCATCASGRK